MLETLELRGVIEEEDFMALIEAEVDEIYGQDEDEQNIGVVADIVSDDALDLIIEELHGSQEDGYDGITLDLPVKASGLNKLLSKDNFYEALDILGDLGYTQINEDNYDEAIKALGDIGNKVKMAVENEAIREILKEGDEVIGIRYKAGSDMLKKGSILDIDQAGIKFTDDQAGAKCHAYFSVGNDVYQMLVTDENIMPLFDPTTLPNDPDLEDDDRDDVFAYTNLCSFVTSMHFELLKESGEIDEENFIENNEEKEGDEEDNKEKTEDEELEDLDEEIDPDEQAQEIKEQAKAKAQA